MTRNAIAKLRVGSLSLLLVLIWSTFSVAATVCNIDSEESYLEYSARMNVALAILDATHASISQADINFINNYVQMNIKKAMKSHIGRSDQAYWRRTEADGLCRVEYRRLFDPRLLENGASPPSDEDKAFWVRLGYVPERLTNNLQVQMELWRVLKQCDNNYAQALYLRSRDLRDAYHRKLRCPIKY
tara:strand:+ start:2074 stop:2634 length:561 start_codon:yes stop_codon:yes gene_type:complete